MELSRFTVSIPHGPDHHIVFNTDSKTTLLVPNDTWASLAKGRMESLPHEAIHELVELGVLVPDRRQEFTDFVARYASSQHSGHVGAWLYLSGDCNLGCPYCYQGLAKPSLRMSRHTIDALSDFITDIQLPYEERSLSVVLYGGEPLLNKDGVDYVLDTFNHNFSDMPRTYFMITNATLINGADEITRWRDKGLGALQITLDGPEQDHDSRRIRLADGSGTFSDIISKMKAIRDIIPISLRINYDHDNIARIPELIDRLADNGFVHPTVTLQLEAVFASTRNEYDTGVLLKHRDESQSFEMLFQHASMRGFNTSIGFEGPCTIRGFSGLVVYPNGDLYSCPGLAGMKDYRWGNVVDRKIDRDRQRESVFEGIYKECDACPLLPVCGGGCEWQELQDTGVKGRHCEYRGLLRKVKIHMVNEVERGPSAGTYVRA